MYLCAQTVTMVYWFVIVGVLETNEHIYDLPWGKHVSELMSVSLSASKAPNRIDLKLQGVTSLGAILRILY